MTTTTTSPATLANLIDQMQQLGPNAMNGWDLVLNMLLEPIDDLFRVIYDDRTPGNWQTVQVGYCQLLPNPTGSGQLAAYTALQMTLSAPQLSFADGQSVLDVAFTADGTLKQAAMVAPSGFDPTRDYNPNDPALQWSTRPLTAEPLAATVPLASVQGAGGQGGDGYQMVLSFPQGSFAFPSLAGAPEPTALTTAVQEYFKTADATYVLSTLPASIVGIPPGLAPTNLGLGTVQTNSGKSVVQFFITTSGTPQTTLLVNVNEPVPDGYQWTLMVRQPVAQQFGPLASTDIRAFTVEAVLFALGQTLTLSGQQAPNDLLAYGTFDLADDVAVASGDGQQVQRVGPQPPGGIAAFGALQAKVVDFLGVPRASETVTFTAGTHPPEMVVQFPSGDGHSQSAVTGTDGIATLPTGLNCYYAQGPFEIVATAAEGGKTAVFNLAVAAAPPPPVYTNATVSIVSGDGQHVARSGENVPGGTATFAPLTVLLRDASGNPISGAVVDWAAGSAPSQMAVQLDPSGAGGKTTTTGSDGTTTLDTIWAYYAEGPFQVIASVPGGATNATFTLTVDPTPPPPDVHDAHVSVVSGDGQHVALSGYSPPGGTADFAPLSVVVKASDGTPMAGVQVQWAGGGGPSAMAIQLDPGGGSSYTTTTGADGTTVLADMGGSSVSCYYGSGAFQVTAACQGGAQGATFNLTTDPAAPPPPHPGAVVTIVAGDGQRVGRSGMNAMFAPMQVAVKDAQGHPLPGVDVSWMPSGPGEMAVQVDPSGASPEVIPTDANGMSILNQMPGGYSVYAYYATGSFTVVASVLGGGSATFNGTVTS